MAAQGKPVFFHLNGETYKRPKRFVVNRGVKSFDSLLVEASTYFRTFAREVRTPKGRHRIEKLEDLERDCEYVVCGRERFKKAEYTGEKFRPPHQQQVKLPEINFLQLNHRKFGNIPGRARIRGQRKKEEIKTIICFCNGIVAKPKRVQLRTDFKMDQVLDSVNDKLSSQSLYGGIYYLYRLDDYEKISEPSKLVDNGQYVAVGRERRVIKSIPYNDQGVASQLTPRRASTKPKVRETKPPRKARDGAKGTTKKKSLVTDDDDSSKRILSDISSRDWNGNSSQESPKETEPGWHFDDFISEQVEEPLRSYARKDSLLSDQHDEEIPLQETIKEKAIDVLGDNGVPLDQILNEKQDSSVDGRSSTREEQQDDHEVKPSVYEASGENKIDAREIQDDRETREDKPIDQTPAEEVADEEIEENNENQEDADEGNNNRQAEEVQDEEIIEENNETKEKDDEQVSPEENAPNKANERSQEDEPSEQNKPSEENQPTVGDKASEESEQNEDKH